ncbi:helix-turn-helix domain-containing protein [Paraburkholderia sp. J10-1]|uniref:helix-turn-helix domain-containing protein n=1 Tax=Paraburkholderia sp. J10-1 TaxID=2805430 RepID=UPI002AB62486|nr:helix-turn-helix domain-containing protein [Paraburkholderia sp. J10-1]
MSRPLYLPKGMARVTRRSRSGACMGVLCTVWERLATGQSILDVALSMGYDSPGAFTPMFKKQLGVVPSEYFRVSE